MRELGSAVYWAVTGALISFGFLGLMSIGLPFLLVGLVMFVYGVFWLLLRGVWAITVGLGAVPAYLFTNNALMVAGSSGPPCSESGEATLAAPAGTGESTAASCSPPESDDFIAVLVFLGVVMLSGPAVRLLLLVRGDRS